MDENHQNKTENGLTATKDKTTPTSLALQDQRENNQHQKYEIEGTIKRLRNRGYKVTEEYSNNGKLLRVSAEYPQRKKLWDWLQLLIVPFLIFFLGIGFTWVQYQTSLQVAQDNHAKDLQIANDTQEEATLKAYLDDMTALLFDKKLGSQAAVDKAASAEAAVIARSKTIVALSRMTNPQRKVTIVQFLYQSLLIGYYDYTHSSLQPLIIDLSGADLSGVDLSNPTLYGVDLSGSILRGAKLNGAKLNDAILRGTDLRFADLSFADLSGVDLTNANLRGADLRMADLSYATLSGADLHFADLRGATIMQGLLDTAASIQGAIMPDGSKHP
jgi:uncharacterized protein YjbI with pentapeptide repeats